MAAGLQYPLLGLGFFLARPRMWCQVLPGVVLLLVLLVAIFPALMVYVRGPQVRLMEWVGVAGWLAELLAVVLIFLETFLALLIVAGVLLARLQDKLFETTLAESGVNVTGFASPGIRRAILTTLLHLAVNIVAFSIALPATLIPFLGPVIFCGLMGIPLAWELHALYFDANALPVADQCRFIRTNLSEYLGFGFTCQLLGLVPLLNVLTLFTNSVGAALWAAELDRTGPRTPRHSPLFPDPSQPSSPRPPRAHARPSPLLPGIV